MDTDEYIVFPERYTRRRLNELYRAIPLKAAVSRNLRKYFVAMTNLYGIIALKDAWKIISEQNPTLVTEEEFIAFADIAVHEREQYCILGSDELFSDEPETPFWEREIIDSLLVMHGIEPYGNMVRMHRGKPFFVPEKKELLSYEDPTYCEDTRETQALMSFLSRVFSLNDIALKSAFDDVIFEVRYCSSDLSDVAEVLGGMGLEFSRKSDIYEFSKILQDLNNNTRMQSNRGYTPNEIIRMMPQLEEVGSFSLGPNIRKLLESGEVDLMDVRRQILTMNLPSETLRSGLLKQLEEIMYSAPQTRKQKKVGRNEPCPCGSGKKYKNCCGR